MVHLAQSAKSSTAGPSEAVKAKLDDLQNENRRLTKQVRLLSA
jgi:hypothetical protein